MHWISDSALVGVSETMISRPPLRSHEQAKSLLIGLSLNMAEKNFGETLDTTLRRVSDHFH